MARKPQTTMLQDEPKAFGGVLLNTRKARLEPRPLDTKKTMHLILRSTQAVGDWSFARKVNCEKISQIVAKFSEKYGVKVISMASVGTLLHFQIKLSTKHEYKKFIRAVSSAIVMAVTGTSRVKKLTKHFWDYRPFTRVVASDRAVLKLSDYIKVNQLDGFSHARATPLKIVQYQGE